MSVYALIHADEGQLLGLVRSVLLVVWEDAYEYVFLLVLEEDKTEL